MSFGYNRHVGGRGKQTRRPRGGRRWQCRVEVDLDSYSGLGDDLNSGRLGVVRDELHRLKATTRACTGGRTAGSGCAP